MLKADAHLPPSRLRRKKYLSSALLIIDELGFEPMDRLLHNAHVMNIKGRSYRLRDLDHALAGGDTDRR